MRIDSKISTVMQRQPPNVLREMLKQASMPHIISLAGGLPAPESFPTKIIQSLVTKIIQNKGSQVLQYGSTEGSKELIEAISAYKKTDFGEHIEGSSIQITTGSQQALDLIGRAFINPGDYIAVESPTYLGALQAFGAYSPQYIALDTDEEGPTTQSVLLALQKKVKFFYLVSDFANPTGKTISLKRRKEIAALIQKHDGIIIEDSPYRELRYEGKSITPLFVFAPQNTLYLGSFSKILAPGLRIGYVIGNPKLVRMLTIAKQGVDLFTSGLDQAIAAEYINSKAIISHIPRIISLYKPKRDAMIITLKTYFPKDTTWTYPEGGMFVWATVKSTINTAHLLEKTLKKNVAFVPGKPFFPNCVEKTVGINTMRLNFTNSSAENIQKAIKVIGEELKKM